MNFFMLPNRLVEIETFTYLSGRVSKSLREKKKKRHQCIIGTLPTTHFNAHPLCLGIHVWNCLHDSRGPLEAGYGSWNWINFKIWLHVVTASPLRVVGQFRTPHEPWPGSKRTHTFLSTSCDFILSSIRHEYFCVPSTPMKLCIGCELGQAVSE